MVTYLLKSGACLAILLCFYKFVLEQENMHNFKRYFLLVALAMSFAIPALIFTETIYVPQKDPLASSIPNHLVSEQTYMHTKQPVNYTYWFFVLIYSLGVLFFSIQFLNNLYRLWKTIKNNPKKPSKNFIKVLLSLQVVPHTFLNYIFLNKAKYEANQIPTGVLVHEETHAAQKHSLDIVFIEILQIIFWFNPLLYAFKKAIKLNHEFLADSAVLKSGLPISEYQKTLLTYSSNEAEPSLANAINYSSIKKRFTVMKKQTSTKTAIFRKVLFAPLLALLLYSFSEKKLIEIEQENLLPTKEVQHPVIALHINSAHQLFINKKQVVIEDLATTLKAEIDPKANIETIYLEGTSEETLTSEFLGILVGEITKTGIKHITFCTTTYKMSETEYTNKVDPKTAKVLLEANTIILTKKEQEKATPSQIDTYNKLAIKYSRAVQENIQIKQQEVEKLKHIYSIMTQSQRASAAPYPKLPAPPTSPKAPRPNKETNAPPKPPTTRPVQPEEIKVEHQEQKVPKDKLTVTNKTKTKDTNRPMIVLGPENIITLNGAKHYTTQTDAGPLYYNRFGQRVSEKGILLHPKETPVEIIEVTEVIEVPQKSEPYRPGRKTEHKAEFSSGTRKTGYTSINNTINKTNNQFEKDSTNKEKQSIHKKSNHLLAYATELRNQGAIFYLDNQPITSEKGLRLLHKKTYKKVETLPWTTQTPEVKIYTH